MAQYGLGNFLYEFEVNDGKANFKFWDPRDASNTAEVSVSTEDFPEGIQDADSRQVADLAFDQCQRVLNEKRDARLIKEREEQLEKESDEDAKARQAAQDHHANSQDVAVAPANVEKDGTHVYNTANLPENQGKSSDSDDKKKK